MVWPWSDDGSWSHMPEIVVLSDRTDYSHTISNLSVSHVTFIVVDSDILR